MSSRKTAASGFNSFSDFYPYYLQEHQNRTNKRLHFVGTTFVFLIILFAIASQNAKVLFLCPLVGYGFAWVGHFFFEQNKPATFKHPFYRFYFYSSELFISLMGDFRMWYDIATGKIIW